MKITGRIVDATPAGSKVDAQVAVPVSGGAAAIFIAFGLLIVFFSGQSLAIGLLLAAAVWVPFWLAVVRMNQRQLLACASELETLLKHIAADAAGRRPHVTFADAE